MFTVPNAPIVGPLNVWFHARSWWGCCRYTRVGRGGLYIRCKRGSSNHSQLGHSTYEVHIWGAVGEHLQARPRLHSFTSRADMVHAFIFWLWT
jgi:hypothetical protein